MAFGKHRGKDAGAKAQDLYDEASAAEDRYLTSGEEIDKTLSDERWERFGEYQNPSGGRYVGKHRRS